MRRRIRRLAKGLDGFAGLPDAEESPLWFQQTTAIASAVAAAQWSTSPTLPSSGVAASAANALSRINALFTFDRKHGNFTETASHYARRFWGGFGALFKMHQTVPAAEVDDIEAELAAL